MSDEMQMLVSFPDQSESFVLGFEAGQIWHEIDAHGALLVDKGFDEGFPAHTANVEVIRRLATARGYEVETKPTDAEEWTAIRLIWRGTGHTKPRLAIVQENSNAG